jgi:hypothetical protein
MAAEVSQRQAQGDRGVAGRPGEEANRHRAQEQRAEEPCWCEIPASAAMASAGIRFL